jgi:hypothetical protein
VVKEVQLLSLLTSALDGDGVGGQPHVPAALPPFIRSDTHSTGDWVGYRNRLDGCEREKIAVLARVRNSNCPAQKKLKQSRYRPAVAQSVPGS